MLTTTTDNRKIVFVQDGKKLEDYKSLYMLRSQQKLWNENATKREAVSVLSAQKHADDAQLSTFLRILSLFRSLGALHFFICI